ncbi:DNA/RNA non-specific endonuclease [Paraburkholderia aspalathi]|nr:DNA/RNA non-specific endonuclease [Paraburkholderia aspalathi]MBK3779906.1 DNA/RNA non-specific endonuclease [Paraburkholderia aspalathi]
MRLTRLLATLAIALLPCTAVMAAQPDFSACPQNFFAGKAPAATEHQPGQLYALCFDGFAVLYSGQSKTPVFSAQYLTRDRLLAARGERRTDKFYEEARLPQAARATLEDYKGVHGIDRGHMSEAATMPSDEAMAQSFSLANVVGQASGNNRGVWARNVERATRKYAMRSAQGVYVLTGPIYSKPALTIGPDHVWLPDTLFKLVYDPAAKKAWAFILPNTDDAQVTRVYSYDDLVRITGMHLLPPDAL